jgi:Peptidase A4 family
MFPALPAHGKALLASLTILVMMIAPSLITTQPSAQTLAMRFAANVATAPFISHNWSGYAATSGAFTSITGTWVVPQVTGSSYSAADATWVGIGGLNRSDLIQSGTQDIVSRTGRVTTVAFIEMLPDAGQPIPVSISRGDAVTVSLTERTTNQWRITFQDNTNRQIYTTTVVYPSSLTSAEWIEEAPSRGHKILPLDNFGAVQFSRGLTVEGGKQLTIAQSNAQSIILENKSSQTLAVPSSLYSGGTSFTITQR